MKLCNKLINGILTSLQNTMITGYYNSTIIQYFMQSNTQTHEGYVYSPHDSIATAYIPFDPAQALYKDGTLSTFTGLSVDIGIVIFQSGVQQIIKVEFSKNLLFNQLL